MTMDSAAKNIFITGLPGSGKTTLIRKLAGELREYGPAGFFTGEIREQGARTGFTLTSLDGRESGMLAHRNIRGPLRVGTYGVDLQGFEQFLGKLVLPGPSPRLVIIDEIGKMECLSERFRGLVVSLLGAPAPVIATIALKAGGFIDEVKRRPDVLLYEITERNREALLRDIAERIRSLNQEE
jgi:nucleoside-triphosphatase